MRDEEIWLGRAFCTLIRGGEMHSPIAIGGVRTFTCRAAWPSLTPRLCILTKECLENDLIVMGFEYLMCKAYMDRELSDYETVLVETLAVLPGAVSRCSHVQVRRMTTRVKSSEILSRKNDKSLGMDQPIARRDFLQGAAIGTGRRLRGWRRRRRRRQSEPQNAAELLSADAARHARVASGVVRGGA